MSSQHSRSRVLRRIEKLQTWIDDSTRTKHERDAARQVIKALKRKHGIDDLDEQSLHGPASRACRLSAYIRTNDHICLAQACAALMDSMMIYHPHNRQMEFIGSLSTAMRAHWLFNYLDQQLEAMNTRTTPKNQIWFEINSFTPEDFYFTAIEVLVDRMKEIELERRRRRDSLTSDCTALVLYRPTGASLEMERVREEAKRMAEEMAEQATVAAAEQATGGEGRRVVRRDPAAARAALAMFIPLDITLAGRVSQRASDPKPTSRPASWDAYLDMIKFVDELFRQR